MATDIGPKIGLDGEKEFRASLQAMGQQLRTLDTEMRAVTSAFSANDKSQAALSAQSDVLTKKLSTQEARLAEIQKALDYARANYAENSNEVQRWQQALNNATADVNKTKQQIKALDDELDKSPGKFAKVGEAIKSGLATAAKAATAAVAAASAAVGVLIKQSIADYGEYEQLVGGVETLFKDSSKTVMGYAKDAYKTAGLSANDYMETVTSFSASLLQSMGNDTEAAAKKANVAITDMSDNANKMGTDMQSIQNAYQGFAKQNYTMLDNLKLGYGGTKEEMQRLINDANALNAAQGNYTNYTIESYADIVDAIHTVQTEMGITGTTALEASTTIEGSITSMKAAWTNFVTGLGNDNADIAELSRQLIQSVETVASNVLPVIETVLTNIAEAVKNDGPEMIEKFVAYALEKLPDIIALGLQMVLALVAGLAQNLPQLVSGVLRMRDTIVSTFVASLPDIIDVGKDIVRGLWEGIKEMGAWLKEKVSDFVGGIVSNVKGFLGIHSPSTVFAGIGENMALGLGKGFAAEMQGVTANIQDAIPTPAVDAVYNAAAGMVNGLAAANAGNGGGSYTINLVLQNGQQIASWLLPDLRDAARNNPEVAMA
nr:MAG TPA: tail tape measure protein [Caudoviricetes sp.]